MITCACERQYMLLPLLWLLVAAFILNVCRVKWGLNRDFSLIKRGYVRKCCKKPLRIETSKMLIKDFFFSDDACVHSFSIFNRSTQLLFLSLEKEILLQASKFTSFVRASIKGDCGFSTIVIKQCVHFFGGSIFSTKDKTQSFLFVPPYNSCSYLLFYHV